MEEQLVTVFKDVLGINNVPEDLSQENCQQWDSINHLNLIIALERSFHISFLPEEIVSMKTLSSINHILKSKLSK